MNETTRGMSAHTPGPLRSQGRAVVGRNYRVALCDGPGGIGADDAARIVACWNACESIADPTEMRAAHTALPGVARNAAELLAQRDELLAACKALYEVTQSLPAAHPTGSFGQERDAALIAARAAIARAEGSQ